MFHPKKFHPKCLDGLCNYVTKGPSGGVGNSRDFIGPRGPAEKLVVGFVFSVLCSFCVLYFYSVHLGIYIYIRRYRYLRYIHFPEQPCPAPMIHITLYSVVRTSYSVLTAGFLPSTEDPPLRGKKKKKKKKRLSATSAEDDRN